MDIYFKTVQPVQPQGLQEPDAILKRLNSPNACKEPQACLNELYRWQKALAQAATLGITLPGTEQLCRAPRSIYAAAMGSDDIGLRLRWARRSGGPGLSRRLLRLSAAGSSYHLWDGCTRG